MALRKALLFDFVCEEPTGTTVIPVEDGPDHDPAEVLMHVRIDTSVWHKRIPGADRTSCGELVDYRAPGFSLRHESLSGQLCPKCFTDYERGEAAKNNAKNLKDVT